jgi:hypothetical protein
LAAGASTITVQAINDPEMKNALTENTKAIKELMLWKPAVAIETYERKRDNWKKVTAGGLK